MGSFTSFSKQKRDRKSAPAQCQMPTGEQFFVYVLGNISTRKLAVFMTQDLQARVLDQQNDLHPRDFTSIHSIHTLVHIEEFSDICEAIARHDLLRVTDPSSLAKLVDENNPNWQNLLANPQDVGYQRQA